MNLDDSAHLHLPEPNPAGLTPEAENLLFVAESRVWSETPAVITSDGATLTHGNLLNELRATTASRAEFISTLIRASRRC